MLRVRSRAAAIRSVFPQVSQLRIELTFSDSRARIPSPQAHTLYPGAPAFFRFACPCANCDGYFDLSAAVASQVGGSPRARPELLGTMRCDGNPSNGSGGVACSMELRYRIIVFRVDAA